jgi:hypothetical protein
MKNSTQTTSDDKLVWEEAFNLTIQAGYYCITAAILCFVVVGFLIVDVSNKELLSFLYSNFDTIGSIASGIVTVAVWFSIQATTLQSNPGVMTSSEKKTYFESLRLARGLLILFFILFGGCFLHLSYDLKEPTIIDILSVEFSAGGVMFLGLTVLCSKMAKIVKTKYLT